MSQLGLKLFEEPEEEKEVEEEIEDSPEFTKMMAQLNQLNEMADAQNNLLRSMIDDLQKDWSEEEKLQINDPKEYQRLQKLKQEEPKIMPTLTVEAIETLKNSKVEGNVVKLPEGQLDRNIYLEVKKSLELIGGQWKGGKVFGFVFNEDPTKLLEQISNGDKRNLKKEFQFFGTPDSLADRLVQLADVNDSDLILEPSAGQGSIVKAVNRVLPDKVVMCYELMPVNLMFLEKIKTANVIDTDFLNPTSAVALSTKFNKIIANPPFSKNQDIDHIMKMWSCLKEGGRIVTVASKHWQLSSNKKEKAFREFLETNNAEIIEIEAGEFKESGTSIATVIIILNKRPS